MQTDEDCSKTDFLVAIIIFTIFFNHFLYFCKKQSVTRGTRETLEQNRFCGIYNHFCIYFCNISCIFYISESVTGSGYIFTVSLDFFYFYIIFYFINFYFLIFFCFLFFTFFYFFLFFFFMKQGATRETGIKLEQV